jgi:L-malate glycosyltransferase
MHILHICSGYPVHKLYKELAEKLDQPGLKQTIYVPVRSMKQIGVNQVFNHDRIQIIYSYILRPYHRLFYHLKIKTVVKDIVEQVKLSDIDLVHAHFLFSDGGVAYELQKSHNIPYVTAVRNTDINYFYKYKPYLMQHGAEILKNSENVIFIAPNYRDKLINTYLNESVGKLVLRKSYIIPNGIPNHWIDHAPSALKYRSDPPRILYVGQFSSNKNVELLIKACHDLNKSMKLSLTLVGSGGQRERRIKKMVASGKYPFVTMHGRIDDESELRRIYNDHTMFAMISFGETFGLVYIEALSQGLPVIYTRGEGIDGYFIEEEIGRAVDPTDIEDVKSAILQVHNNTESLSPQLPMKTIRFKWDHIANQYFQTYSRIVETINRED